MSIQAIGTPPPKGPEPTGGHDPVAFKPPARVAASEVQTAAAVEKAAPVPSKEQVEQAVANINKSLQALSQDLVFSVDTDSHRTIVKVVDQTTKEVIRQIPTPEALEIAKALDTVRGLLIKQTA